MCLPPVAVGITPESINLRSGNGLVTAFITLAPGFDLTQWTVSNVTLNGVPAVSGALSSDGGTYVTTFDKGQLSGLGVGDSVTLSVAGSLQRSGNEVNS